MIKKANLHNLKNIDVSFPLQTLTFVTGVSGSGKSTLVQEVLVPFLEKEQKNKNFPFDSIVSLKQGFIGSNIRSDVSTYTEILTPIRSFYSSLKSAKAKGLQPRYFSYNHKKGMCKTCAATKVIAPMPNSRHPTRNLRARYIPNANGIATINNAFNRRTKLSNMDALYLVSRETVYSLCSAGGAPSVSHKYRLSLISSATSSGPYPSRAASFRK